MEYIRTAEREFTATDAFALEYEGRSGNIVVEGGDDDRVRVQIVAHIFEETAENAESAMEQIVAGVRMDGSTLKIAPPRTSSSSFLWFNRGARIDYAVTVPQRARCRMVSSSGRVEVARVSGPLDVTQKSGRTSVRLIERDVRVISKSGSTDAERVGGAILLQCQSGKISVDRVAGDASLSSQSGSIKVDHVGGALQARSQSGRIDAGDVGGNCDLASQSGRLTLSGARGAVRMHSVSGAATFAGQVLGSIEVSSTSGTIHFDVDPERPFFLDAETVSGSIRSDLSPRSGEGPPPEGAPKVKLRTVSGAIRIGPKRAAAIGIAFGHDFDVEFGDGLDIDIEGSDIEARIGRTIQIKMERAVERAERQAERARRHAERAARRAERGSRIAEDDADAPGDDEADVEQELR